MGIQRVWNLETYEVPNTVFRIMYIMLNQVLFGADDHRHSSSFLALYRSRAFDFGHQHMRSTWLDDACIRSCIGRLDTHHAQISLWWEM